MIRLLNLNLYFTTLLITFTVLFQFSAEAQNVGIGTPSPLSRLSIDGNSTIGSNYIGVTAPSNGLLIEGKLGIGTTTPTSKLQVVDYLSDTVFAIIAGPSKFAARFEGFTDALGAIKNTGSLYDGSVAINDGLTVGDLTGTKCTPNTPTTCSFSYIETLGAFQIDPNQPPFQTSNYPTCNVGECRAVTRVDFSAKFFDFAFLAIKVDISIQNQFQYKVLIPDALDSTWTINFSTNDFNGQDPSTVSNWSVSMSGYDGTGDSDRCEEYTGTINYNWGDSVTASYYAAFGEIRASGTLYANSINPYGDVAEFFEVTANNRPPEAGDIVSISTNTAQAFELTSRANDPLIAGVISENPSVYINNPEMGEPIALTGRVKVKVNNEGGAIKIGDPITSSSTLAEGMKLSTNGMVIGYALENYEGGNNETGKIWILLDKGHYERVVPVAQVFEGKNINLGGLEIKGSTKVTNGTKEVFLPWENMVNSELPNDIEFDDLAVDLNPYGGDARLSVYNVDEKGITVGIKKPSKDFKGFYYNVNIVSPSLYKIDNNQPIIVEESLDTKMSNFFNKYYARESIANKLKNASGKSLDIVNADMSAEEVASAKKAVIAAWRNSDQLLFNQYVKLGLELNEKLRDKELAKQISSSESL